MTRKSKTWDDPVVAEVREIRERLWREAGGDFDGLLRLLDRRVPRRRASKSPRKSAGRS